MSNKFREKILDRIKLIRSETNDLREGIFERNGALEEDSRPLLSDDGSLRLVWKYQPFSLICDTSIKRRRIDCAIFRGDEKIVAADFLEFKALETYSNRGLFREMDDEAADLGQIALAFLSGWDAEELDEGNLATLEHLASSGSVSPTVWGPLLSKFIDQHVLKNSFVLLANPFPHDVVEVINKGNDDEAMQSFAKARHSAKIRFCENHLGMRKFGDDARTSDWTYRVSRAEKFEYSLLAPVFSNFEIRDLGKPLRHDF